MDNTQAYLIIDKIKRLWQTWKPTDDEQTLYCQKLTAFDFDLVSDAVGEHKTTKEGSTQNPKLYHILAICKGRGGESGHKNIPLVNYEVECIEHKEMPWRVGERMKFWATDKKNLLHGRQQEKAAEHDAERAGGVYGGRWLPRLINFDITEDYN